MKKWEYEIIEKVNSLEYMFKNEIDRILKEMGDKGWEFCQVIKATNTFFIFKREVNESSKRNN